MFKGLLKIGKPVEVTFRSDYSNSGTAHLLVAHGRAGQDTISDSVLIAPGASASVSLTPSGKGLLKIVLDVASPTESGMLEVVIGKKPATPEAVKGDVVWTYSVG